MDADADAPEYIGDDEYADEPAPPLNRMVIAVMALIGLMIALYTLLWKLGVLGGPMACGTGECETVQLSQYATQFGIPVPVYGVVGYGGMLLIALLGLQSHIESRWVPRLLLAGGLFAFVFTLYLSYLEAYRIHAWCRWCLASAAVVTVMFAATLPELKRLRQRA
jgi:uncharacterized membrane protein